MSRKNALYLSKICNKLNIDEFAHISAPTACLKCCYDSPGRDTKYFYTKSATNSECAASNSLEVFRFLRDNMIQPKVQPHESRCLMSLSSRNNRYVADVKNMPLDKTSDEDMICPCNGLYGADEIDAAPVSLLR